MPAFHIVVKVLMLRLLLANLSGLSAYDFGYHPSAEEFDSLLRDTRTWTRDLLANNGQRRSTYVPRYSYPHDDLEVESPTHPHSQLDFQFFDDDQEQQEQQQPFVYEQVPPLEPEPHHVESQLIEITDKPKGKPRNASFPIYFTNPATGIVYAITEVDRNIKTQTHSSSSDDDIAIYVTKQQYDADLLALRQQYEQQCPLATGSATLTSPSVLSMPSVGATTSTTARPQIIRLQNPQKPQKIPPAVGGRPPASNKLPHKPPPVMVTSGTSGPLISDQLKLPTSTSSPQLAATRTPKPKRGKRKKKKKKSTKRRPGHRLPTTTVGPQIVLGKRPSSRPATGTAIAATTGNTLPTQLEKPHMPLATDGTIFSDRPFVVSSGYIELPSHNHHIRRRSADTGSAGARPVSSGKRRTGGRRPSSGSGSRNRPQTGSKKKQQQSQPQSNGAQQNEVSGYRIPPAVHLLHAKHNDSKESLKAKPKTRRRSDDADDFDLFDFIGGADYDDDEDEHDDHHISHHTHANVKRDSSTEASNEKNSSSAEEGADFGAMEEDTFNTTSATSSTTAMSSIEATSEETDSAEAAVESTETTSSSSKQSSSKKRIKRRPTRPGDDYDYDDDEEEDEEDDTGIGSFFRMIFYPVQVAMTRIFDGFTGQSEDQSAEPTPIPKYPSYTLYHSAHSNNDLTELVRDGDDDDDSEVDPSAEDQGSSLGSWFNYLFGFGASSKKTTTTTVAPPTATPSPQPEPGWLESWFGFGATGTQASSEEGDYDKWFSSWFDTTAKPKTRRRKTTSTTSSTTSTTTMLPQMPILTIVDPLRNPQNWIGILAHHIANATGSTTTTTTTKNPLLQALASRGTTTTTTPQPVALPRRITYDKYQIWRLKPQDETQVRALEEFKRGEDGNKMQWLKGPSLRGLTDVLVPPKMLVDFQGTLNFESIAHEVLIFDVGKAIAYERSKEQYLHTTTTRRPAKHPVGAPAMTWNKYYEHDDILNYLETLRMRHSQLIELIHIGRSYEGRPLIVVKIESKKTADTAAAGAASRKKLKHKRRSGQANAVFIEAGSQALAWIGPASATWMISELLRLMRSNKTDAEHEFIRNTTWYIMPVLNPDGYVYSHEYDRFWKKSRSQHVAKPAGGLLDSAMTWLQQKHVKEKLCYGVDLDRNWLYHWGKRGSSKGPCNEFYAGPAPFSEPETKAVSEFLLDYRTQIKLFISLQAYGQVVSYPVKANSTFNAERMDDFLDVAMVGTDVLRKKGSKTRYKVDSANDLIEQRSGCADAFATFEIGIPFSYTLQLADNGVHGYLLPSSAIESTARDAFEIITGMLDYI